MAAIAVTISSNSVGMITSSYTLHDHDLSRVLSMLKEEYTLKSPVDVSQEDEDIQQEVQNYTNQQLVEKLTYYFLAGLSDKVRNHEFKIEVEKIKSELSPIAFNKAL